MSLILFAPGNHVGFYFVPLATNGRVVPHNGKTELLEKNTKQNKNKKYLCPAACNAVFLPSLTTSSQYLKCGEQSRHTTTGRGLLLLTGWPSSGTVPPGLQVKTSHNVLCETSAKMKQGSHS